MLKDIIYYILDNHPSWIAFSNARITKLIYLADWKSCLESGQQITNIEWFFDYYGPFVKDVEHEVENNLDIFSVEPMLSWVFWWNKKVFSIKNKYYPNIEENHKVFINFVIEKTANMWFSDFIRYVYSTYPVYKSRKFQKLDLSQLAAEYKTLF